MKRAAAAKKAGASKKPGASKGKSASKNASKNSPKNSSKNSSKGKPATKKKPLAPKPIPAPKPKTIAEQIRGNKTLGFILASINEMKAEDPVTIDLSDKSSIGETMVVATGRSNVHLQSIADRVVKDLKAHGITGIRVEGLRQGDWVLIDAGSVIVHLFRPEVRTFYNIEKMWSA